MYYYFQYKYTREGRANLVIKYLSSKIHSKKCILYLFSFLQSFNLNLDLGILPSLLYFYDQWAPSSGQSFPLCLQSYNLCSYYCNTTPTTTRAGRPLRPIAFFLRSSIAFDYLSLTHTFIFQLLLLIPKIITSQIHFPKCFDNKKNAKKKKREEYCLRLKDSSFSA